MKHMPHFIVLVTCLCSQSVLASSLYRMPRQMRAQYQDLFKKNVIENADGSKSFDKGRYWLRNGVHVLNLKGDRFEMAYQHGRLLKDVILQSEVLLQTSKITRNAIRNSVGDKILGKAMTFYTKKFIAEKMLKNAINKVAQAEGNDPNFYMQEAYAISEATGLSTKTIIAALTGPESAQILLGQTASKFAGLYGTVAPSCSDFTVWGEHTADQEMILGRNTDYPLNGYFEKAPTVIYFEPTDGTQKIMAVTSAGAHNAGVIGTNESGIYLGVHTVPTSHVSPKGLPVFMIGQEVLRRARNFDEALALFSKFNSGAGWSYHLVSTREKKAATIELSADNVEVYFTDKSYHATTNHWRHPDMKDRYLHMNYSVDEDSEARLLRMEQLMLEPQGQFNFTNARKLLADKFDPINKKISIMSNTVAVHNSLTSIIYLPKRQKFFVANGSQGPVSQSTYVEFPTIATFNPDTFATASFESHENNDFKIEHPAKAKSEALYIQAKAAFEYENDPAKAMNILKEAVSINNDNPSLKLMTAMLAVRAGLFSEAPPYLDQIIEENQDQIKTNVALFIRGRLKAHYGDKAGALQDLNKVITQNKLSPKLKIAAQNQIKKLAKKNRIKLKPLDLSVMMQDADAFNYQPALADIL